MSRDEYLRAIRVPWEELEATYREVVATGSQRAVAQAHGWNQAKVRHRVLSYMRHAGIEGDPPGIVSKDHAQRGSMSHLGGGARSALTALRDDHAATRLRLDALEDENRLLRERLAEVEDIRSSFAALHRKLDALLARQAPTPLVTHRRLADGGVGGRRESRRAA